MSYCRRLIPILAATLVGRAMAAIQLTTLATFQGASHGGLADPLTGVVLDGQGNVYGICAYGPIYENGAYGELFEVSPGSSTITPLAEFNGPDGDEPMGGLVMDGNGNIYGATQYGGLHWNPVNTPGLTAGTVFEVAKGSNSITTVASFNGVNGSNPEGGLIMDGHGNLYGTTSGGGSSGYGTIFEIAKESDSITTLASFNSSGGTDPVGGVFLDGAGDLFGTTSQGGTDTIGTVYELAKGSSTISTLASFDNTDGAYPESTLVMDSRGDLFGSSSAGGTYNDGTLFELPKGSNSLITLASYGYENDAPGGLISDASGNIFGTVATHDQNGGGSIFEWNASSQTLSTLGFVADPFGLVADANGNLYGDSISGLGLVFDLSGANFTVPEPSSIGVFLALGICHLRRRKRFQSQ